MIVIANWKKNNNKKKEWTEEVKKQKENFKGLQYNQQLQKNWRQWKQSRILPGLTYWNTCRVRDTKSLNILYVEDFENNSWYQQCKRDRTGIIFNGNSNIRNRRKRWKWTIENSKTRIADWFCMLNENKPLKKEKVVYEIIS